MTEQEAIKAALTFERWCAEHCTNSCEPCDCPFAFGAACVASFNYPKHWGLEEYLRKRGLDNAD